ncbi:helix-turn-helix domain-containing protein [Sphingopyxis alaskensis]|uniref:helix-turn-helix domain-containing protein n=1 Tax=Sphingopyxis alaskensis TaxID=117207 RepID=UPI00391D7B9F
MPQRSTKVGEKLEAKMQSFTTSISQAAKALGLGRTSIYALINEGRLDTIKIGRRRLIKVESIRALIETGQ